MQKARFPLPSPGTMSQGQARKLGGLLVQHCCNQVGSWYVMGFTLRTCTLYRNSHIFLPHFLLIIKVMFWLHLLVPLSYFSTGAKLGQEEGRYLLNPKIPSGITCHLADRCLIHLLGFQCLYHTCLSQFFIFSGYIYDLLVVVYWKEQWL